MNPNFNPEDLYTQRPIYTDGMDDYYEDTIIRKGEQYALPEQRQVSMQQHQVPRPPQPPQQPRQQQPMRHSIGNVYGKPNNDDIPTHIQQYHIQTMPQRSNLDLLENDVNKLFNSKLFDVKDSSNVVGDEHDDELQPGINLDYSTKDLIRNNVGENKHTEKVVDHHIIIDSGDRNVDKYPNPFSYRVLFNVSDTDDANISRVFEKVKNIKLETAVLPKRYYYLKKDITLIAEDQTIVRTTTDVSRNEFFDLASPDASGNFAVIDVNDTDLSGSYLRQVKFADTTEYPDTINNVYEYAFSFTDLNDVQGTIVTDPINVNKYMLQTYNLHDNKFNLLNIDEMAYANEYSTNTPINKSFAVMFPDGCNENGFCTCSKFKDKVHRFNNPSTVSKMTISIRKYDGTLLSNSYGNYTDLTISRVKPCTCGTDENGVFVRNYRCACSYFRHPYYHHFQNTLIFKLQASEIGLSIKQFD